MLLVEKPGAPLIEYVNGAEPLTTLTDAEPELSPKQSTWVKSSILIISSSGLISSIDVVLTHPKFWSVNATE